LIFLRGSSRTPSGRSTAAARSPSTRDRRASVGGRPHRRSAARPMAA
jgi:hypothetical protein